jgi:ligand-binding sensor domain-containing protein
MARIAAIVAIVLACCASERAFAIDPERALSQYLRERWGLERGFPGGRVSAIAQTTDGYLWVGTEKGLVRFDGVTFRQMQPARQTPFSNAPVLGLQADADGGLWALFSGPTLVHFPRGRFEPMLPDTELPDALVAAITIR